MTSPSVTPPDPQEFLFAFNQPIGQIARASSFGWRWEVYLAGWTGVVSSGWSLTERSAERHLAEAIQAERDAQADRVAAEVARRRYPQPEMPLIGISDRHRFF